MLIKTRKSLLIGFQVLLAQIHLHRAQSLWDMNRTEKALTHYDRLLKIPAFLQLARTQPSNVQKAIAVETCGHFLRNSCIANPPLVSAALPRAVLQPWSDMRPTGDGRNIPTQFKEFRPFSYWKLFYMSLCETAE